MPDPIEQRIVDNILGVLRQTRTNGVEEGDPPVDPRERDLPWTWVMVEEQERRSPPQSSVDHTEIDLGFSVLTIFKADRDSDAHKMARVIRAEHEAALLKDYHRGLANPDTFITGHELGASGDGLWGVMLNGYVKFQHRYGDPYTEG